MVFPDIDVREAIDEAVRVPTHDCAHCGAFLLVAGDRHRFVRAPTTPASPVCACHGAAAHASPATLCLGCQEAQLLAVADLWHMRTLNELRSTIAIPSLEGDEQAPAPVCM